jgi:epoxide hydrolase 4
MMRQLILIIALVFMGASAGQAADPAVIHANANKAGDIAYKEGWFGKGDTRLHYVEAGQGPLIILYHGFPSFWYSWFDQMEMLKGRYRVVAVDALGAGLSAKPESSAHYRVPKLAKQLDQLARHLNGNRPFVLIGHDWGSALSLAYAQAYPKRLHGVIGISAPPYNQFLNLVGGNADQQARSSYMPAFSKLTLGDIARDKVPQTLFAQFYGGLIKRGDLSTAEGELFRVALSDPKAIHGGINWYRANIPPFDMITAKDHWPQKRMTITMPALLIWGDADRTFVDSFLTDFPSYAKKGQVVRIPDANHWVQMERPTETNAAINRFLEDIQVR